MNRIVYDMLDPEYRLAEGVSNSQLASMVVSPLQFKYDLEHPKAMTDAFRDGLILDHLWFTPEDPQWWSVIPEGLNLTTKAGIAWKEAQGPGTVRVKWETMERIKGMIASLKSHEDASKALGYGKAQVSVFWDHKTAGDLIVQRKARLDWVPDGDSIVDLKSCQDAHDHEISKSILNYGYHRQGATYLDGWNAVSPIKKAYFTLVFVEKEPPHDIKVRYLDEEALRIGREENMRLLNIYAECTRNNDWPGYETGIKPIGLPKGATPKTEWLTL